MGADLGLKLKKSSFSILTGKNTFLFDIAKNMGFFLSAVDLLCVKFMSNF
jgi:hypothetical protein